MGNEASVPEDEGLQPPSHTTPNGGHEPASESMRVGKAFKAAKAVLQKAADGTVFRDTGGESFYPSQEQSKQYYEDTSSSTIPIPVMYTAEGGASIKNHLQSTPAAAAAAQQAANSIRTGGKVVRNGGRALINSMRNLTVGTGSAKSEKQLSAAERSVPQAPSSGKFRAENAWETNWDDDEDEDDSDESREQDHTTSPQQPPASLAEPPDLLRQPLPNIPYFAPGLNQEWDNGALAIKPPVHEKPSVQMFLPLLRVLGKGSFGKVRS
jgi:hypothetical protein